jgi:hypothetical protein
MHRSPDSTPEEHPDKSPEDGANVPKAVRHLLDLIAEVVVKDAVADAEPDPSATRVPEAE